MVINVPPFDICTCIGIISCYMLHVANCISTGELPHVFSKIESTQKYAI